MHSLRQFLTDRLIWLALLVALGIGALFARAIWTIRHDEWNYAVKTNTNIAVTLEQGLVWALDAYDKSLEGVAREVAKPEVWALPADLRARVVFDNSLRADGMGDVLVLDAQGQIILDSGAAAPRQARLADRDYFVFWRDQGAPPQGRPDSFFGVPVLSRVTGLMVLPISRPYYHPDGRFAGVVVGLLRLSYFKEVFGALDLGDNSGVNLFRQDGVVISRFPYGDADVGKSLAGTANFVRFQSARAGSFMGTAALDRVERLYSYRWVGRYPLIVNVAQSTQTILAQWTYSAWMLGSFAALLMLASLGLALLFVRELALRQKVSAQLRKAEHDLRTIMDNMPSMIGYWDAQLRNRFANKPYFDWFGVPTASMRGMHASELLPPELYAAGKPYFERALQGEPQLFERTMVDAQGTPRHTIGSLVPDVDEDTGKVQGIFVQITDITDRKRMEDELFEEKERERLTLQSIGDAVVCTNAQGVLTYLNPVAERLTGWQASEAAGRSIDEVVQLRSPGNDAPLPSPLHQAIQQATPVENVRGVLVHRTSSQRFQVDETASPIADRHGNVTGAVAVLRDVTDAVAMAERMARLAQYDALTDLPNRVLLQDRAQQAIAQARRGGKALAVMYLDLDGFKQVNDTLGHDMGDRLLVQFAQRLQRAVRASDTLCRHGGDEFVVLLPGLDRADPVGPACAVARKILAAFDAPFDLGGHMVRVGLSGGIALYPEHGDTFEGLSRCADSAMYAAKRGGRMCFMLYRGQDKQPQSVLFAEV